jgi:hypothetical protein
MAIPRFQCADFRESTSLSHGGHIEAPCALGPLPYSRGSDNGFAPLQSRLGFPLPCGRGSDFRFLTGAARIGLPLSAESFLLGGGVLPRIDADRQTRRRYRPQGIQRGYPHRDKPARYAPVTPAGIVLTIPPHRTASQREGTHAAPPG